MRCNATRSSITSLVLTLLACGIAAADSSPKPNVLFIAVDDLKPAILRDG